MNSTKISSVFAVVGAVALSACATAGPRPGLSPEDVIALKSVRQVALSPDGQTAAYTLSEPRGLDEKPGGARTGLFVLRAGDKQAKRFARVDASASSPRFSPDGTSLLFTSRRGKAPKTQVFALPLAGGEAVAVTSAKDGVMSWTVSDDGNWIAYITLADEDPDLKAETKAGRDAQVDGGPVRHHVAFVAPLGGQGAGGMGGPVQVTPGDRSVFEVAFSPDSNHLAVMTAATPRNDDNYMFRTLSMVAADPGKGTPKLTKLASGMGKMGQPDISPDGKWVAFKAAAQRSDGTTGTLWLAPTDASAAPRALNAGAEETVMDFDWVGPDAMLVTAVAGTKTTLSRRTLDGKSTTLFDGASFLGVATDATGSRVALSGSTAQHPNELFVGPVAAPKRKTDHNPWLSKRALGKQSVVQWKSSVDGMRIEGVLIEPVKRKKGQRYPLLVFPHGGPEWQSLDGWSTRYLTAAQVFAGKGYAVLFPNYRGSSGRGAAFAMADHNDLGGTEFQDIIDGVNHLAEAGLVDKARVGMMGGSYGGYMSALAATKGHKHFGAAINFAGIGSWWSFMGTSDIPHEMAIVHWNQYCTDSKKASDQCHAASPLAHIWETKTPLMIVHGAKDLRVPLGQAHELHKAFELRKIPTQKVIYPREGHGLREPAHQLDLMQRAIQWFASHL